jgi:hypothetical protein
LYYTGLETSAEISKKEGTFKNYKLTRDYKVEIKVEIPPMGYTWFLIE